MSINVDVLAETFASLKEYIPAKDRQEAADALMSHMVDYLSDDDLKEFAESDGLLRKAFKEYAGDVADVDDDNYDE